MSILRAGLVSLAAIAVVSVSLAQQEKGPGRGGRGGGTLKNWDGSTDVSRVENGAIVGESSPDEPAGTTYVIWQGGAPAPDRGPR